MARRVRARVRARSEIEEAHSPSRSKANPARARSGLPRRCDRSETRGDCHAPAARTSCSRARMTEGCRRRPPLDDRGGDRVHEHDRTLRRRKCVLSWLEGNAKERVQFMDAGPTMPSVWGATQQRLDSGMVPGAPSGVFGALDPDAPIRAGWAPLDGVDEEDEVDLLLRVWQLIRAGEVDEAARLCSDKGQLWRAVALRGGRLHAVTCER